MATNLEIACVVYHTKRYQQGYVYRPWKFLETHQKLASMEAMREVFTILGIKEEEHTLDGTKS